MPRMLHGSIVRLDTVEVAAAILSARDADAEHAFAPALQDTLQTFDFLFPDLQNDATKLLPVAADTPAKLVALGQAMSDTAPGADPGGDTGDPNDPTKPGIPAAYTYFGQFVDHDITLETASAPVPDLLAANLQPLAADAIRATLRNLRTATLDLDSVYDFPATRNGARMAIGTVAVITGPGAGQVPLKRPEQDGQPKGDDNDLPREPRSSVPSHDRAALIGDPRNDENVIVAQLHLAFLLAHNALVDQGMGFARARKILRQHYQHIVLYDFLKRIADPAIVDDILQNGNDVYDPAPGAFFLPLEYTVAAYRFGHTMVRNAYDFNVNFNLTGIPASLGLLFTFTALSGQFPNFAGQGDFDTLPENWIVEWERIVDAGGAVEPNKARRLDTKLADPGLFSLQGLTGQPEQGDVARLAVRNLLRGYLLRMPTGQAVAQALGRTPLTAAEIEAAAGSPAQVQALQAGGFSGRTPLWYYVLAEAAHGGGQHLGPVGSTIVAEVLVGLARRSRNSILKDPNWNGPTLPGAQAGHFTLADLLRLAGVLPTA